MRQQNLKTINERLLPSWDLLNNVLSVLLKFRKGKHAVMLDIQNMFYQVNIYSKDVNAMRFIWRENQEQPISSAFCTSVHFFGRMDSHSCAYWALRKSSDKCENDINHSIENDFYMDKWFKSVSNEEDLLQLSSKLLIILS